MVEGSLEESACLKVLFDYRPAIAHNKTIIIDPDFLRPVVETGSFNFTTARSTGIPRTR